MLEVARLENRGMRLRNYSFTSIDAKTFPIAALSAIQYGRALDRLIRDLVISYPSLGPVYVLEADISDGFYCIVLHPKDKPKLGLGST